MKKTTDTLQFIVPNEKQRKQWDALVNDSPNGNIYSLSWYLDVVTDNKWGIVANENISCGFPVAFKKRTGYKNIYQPFYTMFFDAIGDTEKIQPFIDKIANDYHYIHITTQSKPGHLQHRDRARQEMVLTNDFAKNYSENTKRQLKKAEKNELNFSLHENGAEVVRLFKENKGKELKEYKAADFNRLEKITQAALIHKNAFCAHVSSEKKVLASGIFLTFKNRVIFLKGGVNDEGKEKGAMYYLMHKVIEHCVQKRDTRHETRDRTGIFDFGGSNNKNVAEFYRKFGGKDLHYFEVELDRRNLMQKIIGKLRK